MKNIDYKQLKRYDVGKQVINNGYQGSTQSVLPSGYVEKPITTMNNAISGLNMQMFTDMASRATTYGSIFGNKLLYDFTKFGDAASANVEKAISNGLVDRATGMYTEKGVEAALGVGYNQAGQDILAGKAGTEAALKGSGQTVTKGGLSTAGKLLAGAGAAYGAFNTAKDIAGFYTDRMSGADVQNATGTTTSYFGNVPYKQYTGFDAQGMKKLVSKQNLNGTLNTALDAAGMGASIGSFVGPIGTAVGGAIGAIGGALAGIFGGKSRSNYTDNLIQNTSIAQQNWNTQSASEGMSQAMRNNRSVNYADGGLNPKPKKGEKANAWIQGGEPVVRTHLDSNSNELKVDKAMKFPITEKHPERVDNILVNLKPQDAVLGNKIDPITGERFAVEGRPLVDMANSSNPNEAEIGKQGLALLVTRQLNVISNNKNEVQIDTQDVMYADQGREPDLDKLTWVSNKKKEEYKMTRVNKRDMLRYSKSLPKYDFGTPDLYNIIPGMIGVGTGLAQYYKYKKATPVVTDTYVPNTQAQHALDMMPKYYDPTSELNALHNTVRQAKYNNRVLSPGQRMLMNSQLYNNYMLNQAAVLDNAAKQTAQYRSAYAQLDNQIGEQDAARRTRSRELIRGQIREDASVKNSGEERSIASTNSNLFNMFSNFNNNYWTNRNIGLYEQKLAYDMAKDAPHNDSQSNSNQKKPVLYYDPTDYLRALNYYMKNTPQST